MRSNVSVVGDSHVPPGGGVSCERRPSRARDDRDFGMGFPFGLSSTPPQTVSGLTSVRAGTGLAVSVVKSS